MKTINTLKSFFKIGIIGFGGGSALIPVVEAEVVHTNPYVSNESYTGHTIISNITPGALPVKLGMLCGYDMAGMKGMLTGAFAVTLPGVLVMILLLSLISVLGDEVLTQIEFASVGIGIFIIFLLFEYIHKVMGQAKKETFFGTAIFLMVSSFFLTGGKQIRHMLTILFGENPLYSGTAWLGLSTIQLLVLAFFVIFFTQGNSKGVRMKIAIVISIFYVLLFSKAQLLGVTPNGVFPLILLLIAAAAAVYDAKKDNTTAGRKPGSETNGKPLVHLLKKITAFGIVIIISYLIAYLVSGNCFSFFSKGLLSTITSFGGGEAYLTVADGMFVTDGAIDSTTFYGQIVPIANALPGPILVKILAAIGYTVGFGEMGMAAGFSLALLGLAIGVGGTCIVALIIDTVYRAFSNLQVFLVLKRWILPIISGLLLTTILSMLSEVFKVMNATGIGTTGGISILAVFFAGVVLLIKKWKLKDVFVIVIMSVVSICLLNLL